MPIALPSTLADAGAALKLEQQKMPEGKALIKYFCVPYAVVIDGVPQFHAPSDAPEKWEIFKTYNRQDVVAELAIDERLSRYPVPAAVWEEFYLDQEINDRGIAVDTDLADAALRIDASPSGTDINVSGTISSAGDQNDKSRNAKIYLYEVGNSTAVDSYTVSQFTGSTSINTTFSNLSTNKNYYFEFRNTTSHNIFVNRWINLALELS